MGNPKFKRKNPALRKERRLSETEEISTLEEWIESGKPDSGTNPISFPSLPDGAPVGRTSDGGFSPYAGCTRFDQMPLSRRTKDGLKGKFVIMSDIQRASLPHVLCGRDVLGAAKTGSGKTLAFIIPILEKLYRLRWGPEDGVGSIIISPTKELASQLFEVLKTVGKYHGFSAGLLIGGRKDVDAEKERVSFMNILVCTPGRLLQHMDETPNFECSQLQVLVLDEADRILDEGFRKELDAIISQLPKGRQTLLFSATQTKSVRDLARLSLKDPEYLSVHAESMTATPESLKQIVMEVPLEQKMDMLWSFIKTHVNSKMIVFLSTCKQVKFVFEIFKKLRPGIPLKCLHGRMKQDVRLAIYSQFSEKRSLLFSTDVASRGLDFPEVDWVIQFDCPEDVPTYIHRVGRTARFTSKGKSVLFLLPSEREMMTKLQAAEPKIPVQLRKANTQRLQSISDTLSSTLAKYPNLNDLAQKAFIRYCRSIHKQKDKEVFDVLKLPLDEFAQSLGLPVAPKVRFLTKMKGKKAHVEVSTENEKMKAQKAHEETCSAKQDLTKTKKKESNMLIKKNENHTEDDLMVASKEKLEFEKLKDDGENDIFLAKNGPRYGDKPAAAAAAVVLPTRVSKKKKLKINLDRPVGTRVVFDDEGNKLAPLAALAANADELHGLESELSSKVNERYMKMREEMKHRDKEDKLLQKKRLREGRTKDKMKIKRRREEEVEEEEDEEEEEVSGSDSENRNGGMKGSKVYFNSDNDDDERTGEQTDAMSLAEQEALALKLLNSMHS